MSNFICINLNGPRLTEKVCDVLIANGADMLRSSDGRRRIRGSDYDGEIRTEGERVVLGMLVGILLEAEIDLPIGHCVVHYLLQEDRLDEYEYGDHSWTFINETDPQLN